MRFLRHNLESCVFFNFVSRNLLEILSCTPVLHCPLSITQRCLVLAKTLVKCMGVMNSYSGNTETRTSLGKTWRSAYRRRLYWNRLTILYSDSLVQMRLNLRELIWFTSHMEHYNPKRYLGQNPLIQHSSVSAVQGEHSHQLGSIKAMNGCMSTQGRLHWQMNHDSDL